MLSTIIKLIREQTFSFPYMSNVPKEIIQVSETTWELPQSFKKGMNVPARIVATRKLLDAMDLGIFDQVTNVALLPGIQRYALCMPDGH